MLTIYLMPYLTTFARARVVYEMVHSQRARGAELVIFISYLTSTGGIMVLSTPPPPQKKNIENWTKIQKKTPYKITRMLTIFVRAWYNES